MRRQLEVDRLLSRDASLDPWIYKFSLSLFILSFLATCVRLALSLHSYTGEVVPYGGTLISIPLLASLTYILWRRPHTLRPVVTIFFIIVTLKIGFQLAYVLFVSKTLVDLQLLWISGLMSVNYLTPFIIFRSRVATFLSLTTLGLWMSLTGIYVAIHWGVEPHQVMLIVFSQLYASHALLIVLMAMFVRLRGLYLGAQKSVSHMEKLAHTDFLLGTANRRTVQMQLRESVAHATNAPLSVVLVDIDHFKAINDEHGHVIGDEVLIEVANLISKYCRSFHDFGRWGGEEFLVILPNSNLQDAHTFAERIRRRMETYEFCVGQVTASFGVAQFCEGDTLTSLLKRADDALYRSKQLGRNRVELVQEH